MNYSFRQHGYRVLAASVLLWLSILISSQTHAADVTFTATVPVARSVNTSLTVSVCDNASGSCRSRFLSIGANNTSVTGVVTNVSPGTKFIRTTCSFCASPVVRQGFVTGNESSTEFEDRKLFTIGTDPVTIPTFALAEGAVISGQFTTPVTQTNERNITFSACNAEESCESNRISMPANTDAIAYEVAVPPNDDYELSFNCSNCDDPVFDEGYYAETSPNTTSTLRDNATMLTVTQGLGDINLRAVLGTTITGTIFSPLTVNSNVTGSISFRDTSGDFNETKLFTLASGTSSTTYSILVAPENDWTVGFSCSSCPIQGVFGNVFFSKDEPQTTSWNANKATEFSGSTSQTVKDVTFYLEATVSGSVIMPDATRSQSHSLEVFAFNEAENAALVNDIFMRSTENNSSYSISVPAIFTAQDPLILGVYPDTSTRNRLAESYVPYAFHDGTTNSQTNRNNALPVNTTGGNVAAADIYLETGNTINGTINVPNGEDADSNLLIHMITDRLSNAGADLAGFENPDSSDGYGGYGGNDGNSDSGFFLYNESNAGLINYFPLQISANAGSQRFYSVRIPSDPDTLWRTYYGCLNCGSEFEEYGFYRNVAGTELNPNETSASRTAASFVPGGQDYTHNLVLVKPGAEDFCLPVITASGNIAVICL